MMDKCSCFIDNKAWFGGYPNHETLGELIQAGITHFIDLTTDEEKKELTVYYKMNYISFPIPKVKIHSKTSSFI